MSDTQDEYQVVFSKANGLRRTACGLDDSLSSKGPLRQFAEDANILIINCEIRARAEIEGRDYQGAADTPALRAAHYLVSYQVVKDMTFGDRTLSREIKEKIKEIHHDITLLCSETLNEGKALMARAISKGRERL